jgi:hypothetical protein
MLVTRLLPQNRVWIEIRKAAKNPGLRELRHISNPGTRKSHAKPQRRKGKTIEKWNAAKWIAGSDEFWTVAWPFAGRVLVCIGLPLRLCVRI